MKKLITAILILVSISFSGCVEKSIQGNNAVTTKDCVVYNMGEYPKDLIMLDNSNIRQQDLLVNLFEGLVKTDGKGNIIPGLSDSWTLSKDETCYTFNIRKDAKYSDGSDITAEDFVTFFSQVLNKDTKNSFAEQLYFIFGAYEYNSGKGSISNVAIRAVDKKKLEIRLNYPCNYFLNILSQPIYSLRKINYDLVDYKKNYKSIQYTGGFIIDDISSAEEIILKKNENYYNRNSVISSKIIITSIDESESALAAYAINKVDIFTNPPKSEVKKLVSSAEVLEIPSSTTNSLVFNLKKEGLLRDTNFRKAVASSIDRGKIAKELLNDTAKPALTFIPPNTSNGLKGKYMNKVYFPNSSESDMALDLIKKTKFDKKSEAMKLVYIDTIENKKVCENISKNLKEILKLRIEAIGYSKEEFIDELNKGSYDLALIQYEEKYDYPLSFLEVYTSKSKENIFGYKNIQFDTVLEKSKVEKDKNKKVELLRQGENILFNDMPLIPLYCNNITICKKRNVEGIYTTEKGNIKLDKVYINYEP